MTHSRTAPSRAIPQHLLIASGAFAGRLSATRVAAAIARGVRAASRPTPDLLAIGAAHDASADVRALLDELQLDARMRAARAVVVAWPALRERALAGSFVFEIASRARQGGVPAYAVTALDALDPFDARMLDLQLIIQARDARELAAAGRRLAEIA